MARTLREANLSTREARKRLAVSKKPYFRLFDEGLHLGYRKSANGSAWVVRWYVGEKNYRVVNLAGRPDDVLQADGATVLNWSQAQTAARGFFEQRQRELSGLEAVPIGPYTVADAMNDYLLAYKRRGGKAVTSVQYTVNARIVPAIGKTQLSKLTRATVEKWFDDLANSPANLRVKPGKPQKHKTLDSTPEGIRRRRSTANRVLSILKAALNLAFSQGKVTTDMAWRFVKAFREVDGIRINYLNDDQARTLVHNCDPELKPLVQAALLTGCRFGELARLVTADFNPDSGTVHIRISKSGKPRHVYLSEEGVSFFSALTDGQAPDAIVFLKNDGVPWGPSQHLRQYRAACVMAGFPTLTFHELRHTYASRLIMKKVPLAVVAAQLGHTSTRMVEKHYGHLSQNYVADTIRAAFGTMNLVDQTQTRGREIEIASKPRSRRETPEHLRLSREQLFDLVWAEPMTKVAARFGITDRALGKRCERLDMPVPPRGYWQRLSAGHRPAKPSLPPLPARFTPDAAE